MPKVVSQKTRYAFRALLELAKRYGDGPVKIGEIAESQTIPPRFLEIILSSLRKSGYVDSRRGNDGGYYLLKHPDEITAADVLRTIDGPIGPVCCDMKTPNDDCPLFGSCTFFPMWEQVRTQTLDVFDGTTLTDLVLRDNDIREQFVPMYSI